MSEPSLYDRFVARNIDPASFDHRAHLEVGWHALTRLPTEAAERQVREGLRAIALAAGATTKYNDTMTIAFMRLIAARDRAESFEAFLETNGDLLTDPRDLLARHYSRDRLVSEEARAAWLPPDLLPLPRPE